MSLVGMFPPLEKGDLLLIDGGYADISPVDLLRQSGLKRVISVDPSQKRHATRPRNGLGVYLRSVEVTQDALSRLRHNEADYVLSPHFYRTVGVLDFQLKRLCIAAGVAAVLRALPELSKQLGRIGPEPHLRLPRIRLFKRGKVRHSR